MGVSDRDIDRAMKYGLEDFDWFWAVVELLRGQTEHEGRQSPSAFRNEDEPA